MAALLHDYPAISRDMATTVLDGDATLLYASISIALDKIGHVPSERPLHA
ncbi:hypothetical protein GTP38_17010 [Duganella sp. FT94W]|uniref:DUF3562 domain-containing protein n=1 Tax=Duganella lactea TaxID=2692173 RepID=A0ABW9V930_9BURK|nr:hypothetical protein [Duganella lactea]MYM36035.1 hypothetical protein [Duganella lactea]